MVALEPASAWRLHDRGLLREGVVAALRHKATGYRPSIVNGHVWGLSGPPASRPPRAIDPRRDGSSDSSNTAPAEAATLPPPEGSGMPW